MNLTIETTELEKLLKSVFPRVPPKKAVLRLTASDGSLVLQSGDVSAGTSLVQIAREGDVSLPAKTFRQIVATYKGTPSLEIEGGYGELRLNSLRIPVSS